MIVGRVRALWRYPVKSMLGEPLERARLGPRGVDGDRVLALRDRETGRVLSAKRVAALLGARARGDGASVTITLPDGRDHPAADPRTGVAISAWLRREVELVRPVDGHPAVIESESGVFLGRPGGFFDSSPIHLVTTSALERLAELHPAGRFDPRRFRPNVVLETLDRGFVEEAWLGRALWLGGALLHITKPCARCVMTTHAQEDLPVDRDILRTVIRENAEHVGVYARVREPGTAAVGDEALLT